MNRYIIIEKVSVDYPIIIAYEDGTPMIFDTLKDVELEAEDCQEPQIVEI